MTARQSSFTRAKPDARRQSLIEAAARCLAERGAAGVSVRAICAEAGVSPGLLRHYFPSVSEAIAETCRWIGEQIADALDEAVAAAGPDPRARLLAYVTANFRPPIASSGLLSSYVALWSLTRSDPQIAKVRAEVYSDFRTGLEVLIEDLRPDIGGARLQAVALTALIDGLWLELSLGQAPFTTEEAERLAELWLDSLLG